MPFAAAERKPKESQKETPHPVIKMKINPSDVFLGNIFDCSALALGNASRNATQK